MFKQIILISILLFSFTYGQSSKDLAGKGTILWRGYECSELYRFLGDTIKGDTFFNIGFNEGRLFLKAIEDNKITKEDLYQVVPKIIEYILVGPSIDFVLGRVHTIAEQDAILSVSMSNREDNSDIIRTELAKAKIEKCGCKSLK